MPMTMAVDVSKVEAKVKKLDRAPEIMTRTYTATMRDVVGMVSSALSDNLMDAAARGQSEMAGAVMGEAVRPVAPANPDKITDMLQTAVAADGPDVLGKILPTDKKRFYLQMIEEGRARGGYPPSGALADWAMATLGVSEADAKRAGRALSKAIGLMGIQGSPMMRQTLDKKQAEITRAFEQAGQQIVKELEA